MKTVCKKLLSLMLVAVLLVSAVPMMASADEVQPLAGPHTVTVVVKVGPNDSQTTYSDTRMVDDGGSFQLDMALVKNIFGGYTDGTYEVGSWYVNPDGGTAYTVGMGGSITVDKNFTVAVRLQACAHTNYTVTGTVAATCVKDGKETRKCNVCGRTWDEVLPATGNHNFEWKVTTVPTASQSGIETQVCSVCGATGQTRTVAKTGVKVNFVSGLGYTATKPVDFEIGKSMSLPNADSVNGWVFKGWYTQKDGNGTKLQEGTICDSGMEGATYYAWYYDNNKLSNDSYSVILRVYLKSNLQTPDNSYNISGNLAVDGRVSMSEVKNYLMERYTAKTSAGIVFDGLYQGTGDWVTAYLNDDKSAEAENVDVAVNNGTIYMNVVLDNATRKSSSSSSSNADRSNPKTGDSIYTAVAVMGLSVTALAAVYFINKKRIAY